MPLKSITGLLQDDGDSDLPEDVAELAVGFKLTFDLYALGLGGGFQELSHICPDWNAHEVGDGVEPADAFAGL